MHSEKNSNYIKKEKVTNLTTNNLPTLKSNTMKN